MSWSAYINAATHDDVAFFCENATSQNVHRQNARGTNISEHSYEGRRKEYNYSTLRRDVQFKPRVSNHQQMKSTAARHQMILFTMRENDDKSYIIHPTKIMLGLSDRPDCFSTLFYHAAVVTSRRGIDDTSCTVRRTSMIIAASKSPVVVRAFDHVLMKREKGHTPRVATTFPSRVHDGRNTCRTLRSKDITWSCFLYDKRNRWCTLHSYNIEQSFSGRVEYIQCLAWSMRRRNVQQWLTLRHVVWIAETKRRILDDTPCTARRKYLKFIVEEHPKVLFHWIIMHQSFWREKGQMTHLA